MRHRGLRHSLKNIFIAALTLNHRLVYGTTPNCAPITNNQTLGTFPAMVSKTLDHCLSLYSSEKSCDRVLAGAGAETGNRCISVNIDSTQPYPNYTNCSSPTGDQRHYEIPNCLTQIRHVLAQGINNDTAIFYLCGGNDVFNNILKLVKHASHLLPKRATLTLTSSADQTLSETQASDIKALKQQLQSPQFRQRMYLSVTQSIPELSHIVKNIEQGIVEALDAGANPDQLMYSTLIDFSKVPAALELLPKNGLLRSLGIEILKAFSYELNQNIISGILKHLPESQIMRFDELFEDLHKRPKHYGLDAKNIEHTCVELQKMPNCSGLLFFNGKHPTNLGHHIIANDIITSFGKEFLNKSVIQWIGDSLSDTGNNRYCKDRPTNVQRQNKTSKVLVDTLYNRSARETRSIRGVRPSAAMPTNTRSLTL